MRILTTTAGTSEHDRLCVATVGFDPLVWSPQFLYTGLLFSILLSPFLEYIFHIGIVAYGPLIIFSCSMVGYEIICRRRMLLKDWMPVILVSCYSTVAGLYYFRNPYEGQYLSAYLVTILALPLILLAVLRLQFYEAPERYHKTLISIVCLFLTFELLICLGQVSTYLYGIGLPINVAYRDRHMLTGTFFNSNGLAAVVLLASMAFSQMERRLSVAKGIVVWAMILTLLIMTASRSALLATLVVFVTTRRLRLGNIVIYSALCLLLIAVIVPILSDSGIALVDRVSTRIDSIGSILQGGISTDHSMSLRMSSYIFFLHNLPRLGFGSGVINNYFKYANGANFGTSLMFQNPHSLIVEVGYWLGWPGLVAFLSAAAYLFKYCKAKVLSVFVIGVASFIPSSTLQTTIFFLFSILIIMAHRSRATDARRGSGQSRSGSVRDVRGTMC